MKVKISKKEARLLREMKQVAEESVVTTMAHIRVERNGLSEVTGSAKVEVLNFMRYFGAIYVSDLPEGLWFIEKVGIRDGYVILKEGSEFLPVEKTFSALKKMDLSRDHAGVYRNPGYKPNQYFSGQVDFVYTGEGKITGGTFSLLVSRKFAGDDIPAGRYMTIESVRLKEDDDMAQWEDFTSGNFIHYS